VTLIYTFEMVRLIHQAPIMVETRSRTKALVERSVGQTDKSKVTENDRAAVARLQTLWESEGRLKGQITASSPRIALQFLRTLPIYELRMLKEIIFQRWALRKDATNNGRHWKPFVEFLARKEHGIEVVTIKCTKEGPGDSPDERYPPEVAEWVEEFDWTAISHLASVVHLGILRLQVLILTGGVDFNPVDLPCLNSMLASIKEERQKYLRRFTRYSLRTHNTHRVGDIYPWILEDDIDPKSPRATIDCKRYIAPQSDSPLLRLPREIRDMILEEVLVHEHPIWIEWNGKSPGENRRNRGSCKVAPFFCNCWVEMAPFSVCRQLYNECLPLFWKKNTFEVDAMPYCTQEFLRFQPREAIRNLSQLSIPYTPRIWLAEDHVPIIMWEMLLEWIQCNMTLGQLTIGVPPDWEKSPEDEYYWDEVLQMNEDYWWPAARQFVSLLMHRHIDALQLEFQDFYPMSDAEEFDAVKKLRRPWKNSDLDELLDPEKLIRAFEEQEDHWADPLLDASFMRSMVQPHQGKDRTPVDFVAAVKERAWGDIGTVITLTRRTDKGSKRVRDQKSDEVDTEMGEKGDAEPSSKRARLSQDLPESILDRREAVDT
jgi:hypothetical protein